MKKAFYLGASMLAVVAGAIVPASAADMYRAEPGGYKDGPVYVPANTWTGFYIGVNGGYGWSANSDQFTFLDVDNGHGRFGGLAPKGGFGGGQIGYNWQTPGSHLLLGVEADLQGADMSDSRTFTVGDNPVDEKFKSSLDWFGTVRGRIGYAFDTSLIYVTGGFAFGGIDNEVSTHGETTFKKQETATGYVLGGGYEYKFNPAWSLKAEYQYLNLGKNDPVGVAGDNNGIPLSSQGTKVNDDAFHTVRVGLNYHVGHSYEPLK